jgi:hypothetical protein
VSIYQNTIGFLVHLAIAIYNSKILGEFLPFCAYVLCQVMVSFIAKVVHALRSLAFKSKHIANRQNGSIVISQVLALVIASVGSIAITAVLASFIAKRFWNRF